jgi:hypothetical protein
VPVILGEQHSQEWTSAAIVGALRRRGYHIREWHPTQDLEKFVPADWLFFDRTRLKVFGVQYKALYRNGVEHWPITREQHDTMAEYPWIVYCASEITRVDQEEQALRLARFYGGDFPYQARLYRRTRKPKYLRWTDFIRGFETCLFGRRVKSKEEFRELLAAARGAGAVREAGDATDYLFLNLDLNRGLRVRRERQAG